MPPHNNGLGTPTAQRECGDAADCDVDDRDGHEEARRRELDFAEQMLAPLQLIPPWQQTGELPSNERFVGEKKVRQDHDAEHNRNSGHGIDR